MSYQVLARKWRPRTFQDLVGQEPVLRVLRNALDRNRLHHAYLFSGTRGVGKTTLARILAKCLNCEVKLSGTPCGTCPACLGIDSGQFLDLYEIDAASRTKVEDMRELLENVAYPPVQGRYKVYLIDEVHMLSGHSFNALLKTLEEPPPHVLFIFATTEPKRLPITVLSRCLQFHLKAITPENIAAHMGKILASEGFSAEPSALTVLAQAAQGSLRDALSLLDQAIGFCEGNLRVDLLNQMLGYISFDQILSLMQALANQDVRALFDVLVRLEQCAPDYHQVLMECISLLHQVAMAQVVPESTESASIRALSQQWSAEEVQLYYQIALVGQKDLPYTPTPAQGFEMVMLRMLAFRPELNIPFTGSASVPSVTVLSQPVSPSPSKAPISVTSAAPIEEDEWRTILPRLALTGLSQALALNCSMRAMHADRLELALAARYQPMLNDKLRLRIEEALSHYYKRPIQLMITVTEEEVDSPARQQEAEKKSREAEVLGALEQAPTVKKIKTLFNAVLDPHSLAGLD